jgi:hypothetical protein
MPIGLRNGPSAVVLPLHVQAAAEQTRQEDGAAAASDVRAQIAGEIYAAFERHADEELLSIIGSWRDTLDDREVLSLLRDYNSGRPTLHRAQ